MKSKNILMIALAAGALLSSCDMDKEPYDSLPDGEALKTPINFQAARVGLYSAMKASVAGSFYTAPELQCDGFNAVAGFSNTLGDMYRWNFTPQTGTFETVYGNYQALISRANFIIDGYNKADLTNTTLFPTNPRPSDVNQGLPITKETKGDAFFMRAYAIFGLAQYFCADYDAATATQENSGVSYRLDYAPSENPSTYPGRYTLAQTYQQIKDDLDSASVYVTQTPSANCSYISVDAITALRARVALAMDDYDLAIQESELLINSDKYSLASSKQELYNLWNTSSTWQGKTYGGTETILLLATASSNELPLQSGVQYLPYSNGAVPDYIPTQSLVDLYSDKDYRKAVYFTKGDVVTNQGGVGNVYELNKYADRGVLYQYTRSESARFAVEPRVFRIAEMYLIAAEAYAQKGDLESAADYLNELEESRIAGFTAQNYSDKDIFMAELRKEREREMLAEGSRLFDLKRWKMGVKRGTPQQLDLCLLPGASTTELNMPANSYRMVWPIPKHEIDVNKKIVQNPGY